MSSPRTSTRVRVPPRLGIVGSQVSGDTVTRDASSPKDASSVPIGPGARGDDRTLATEAPNGEAADAPDRETDAGAPHQGSLGTPASERSPSPARARASNASPTVDVWAQADAHAKAIAASHLRAFIPPLGLAPPPPADRPPGEGVRAVGISPRVKEKPRVEDPHAARKERLREMETWTLLSSRMQALDRHLGDAMVRRHAFSSSMRFLGSKPPGAEWEPAAHRAGSPQPPPLAPPTQPPRHRSSSDVGTGGMPEWSSPGGDADLRNYSEARSFNGFDEKGAGPGKGMPPGLGPMSAPKAARLHARTVVPVLPSGVDSLADAGRADADASTGAASPRLSFHVTSGGVADALLTPLRLHGGGTGGTRPGGSAWADAAAEGAPGGLGTAMGAAGVPVSPGSASLNMQPRGSAGGGGWTATSAIAPINGINAGGGNAATSALASAPQVPRLKMPQLPRVVVNATASTGREALGSPQTARPRLQGGGADAGDTLFPSAFSSVASLRGGGAMWKAGTDAPGLAWIQRLVGYIDRHPLSEVLAAYEQGLSPPRPEANGAGSLYLDAHASAPTRGDVAAVEGWLQQVLADAAVAKLPGAVVRDAKGGGTYLGLQGEKGAELAECALTLHRNAFQEICHQVTLHCRERGQLLQSVWQHCCTLLEVKLRLAYDDEVQRLQQIACECQHNVRMGQELLDAKVSEMRDEIEASNHREKLLEREKRKLTQHLIKWEAEARAESHQFEAVNEEMKDVMRQLRYATSRVHELEEELGQQHEKQRAIVSAHEEQVANMQTAVQGALADLAAANRQVEEGKAAYDKVTSQFKRVAMERALLEVEFRAETQRLVESKGRADQLEVDLEAVRLEVSRLSETLAARDAELAKQTQRALVAEKLAEGRLCEAEAGRERVVAAERMYAKMRAECEQMRTNHSELDVQRADALVKLAETTERCEAAVREAERCQAAESLARADLEAMTRTWQDAARARDLLGIETTQLKRAVHGLFTQMAEWGKPRGWSLHDEDAEADEDEEAVADGDPGSHPTWQKLGPEGAGQLAMAKVEQLMMRVMAESDEAARSVVNMQKRMEVMEKSKDNIQEQMSLYRGQYEEACARLKARDNLASGAQESTNALLEQLAQAANDTLVARMARKELEEDKRNLERSVEALRLQLETAEKVAPDVQKIKMQLTVERAQHGVKKLECRRLMQAAEADAERVSQLAQVARDADKEREEMRVQLAACRAELEASKRVAINLRVASNQDASLSEWKEKAARFRSQVCLLWERMKVMANLAPSAHIFLSGLDAVLETIEGGRASGDDSDGGHDPSDAVSLALKMHKDNADLIAKAFLHALPVIQRLQEGRRDPRSVPLLRFRIAGLEIIRQALRRAWAHSMAEGALAALMVRELRSDAATMLASAAQDVRDVALSAVTLLASLHDELAQVKALVAEAGAQAAAHVGDQRRRLSGQLAHARAEIRAWEAKLVNRVDVGIQRSECIGGNLMWESFREQLQLREAAGATVVPQAKKLVLKSIVHIYDGWITAEEKRVKSALAGHKPARRQDVYQTMLGVFVKVFGNYTGSPALENMEMFLRSCRSYDKDPKVAMFTRLCGLSNAAGDATLEADFFFYCELLYCLKMLLGPASWGELTDAWSKGAAYLPSWVVLNLLGNCYNEDKPALLPIYVQRLAPTMVQREGGLMLELDTLLQAAVEEKNMKIFPMQYFMAPRMIVSPTSAAS